MNYCVYCGATTENTFPFSVNGNNNMPYDIIEYKNLNIPPIVTT